MSVFFLIALHICFSRGNALSISIYIEPILKLFQDTIACFLSFFVLTIIFPHLHTQHTSLPMYRV